MSEPARRYRRMCRKHRLDRWSVRYPIKSLDGEAKRERAFNERGVELTGCGHWSTTILASRRGKHTRRSRKLPGLLRHTAHIEGNLPIIGLADARSARIDAARQPNW